MTEGNVTKVIDTEIVGPRPKGKVSKLITAITTVVVGATTFMGGGTLYNVINPPEKTSEVAPIVSYVNDATECLDDKTQASFRPVEMGEDHFDKEAAALTRAYSSVQINLTVGEALTRVGSVLPVTIEKGHYRLDLDDIVHFNLGLPHLQAPISKTPWFSTNISEEVLSTIRKAYDSLNIGMFFTGLELPSQMPPRPVPRTSSPQFEETNPAPVLVGALPYFPVAPAIPVAPIGPAIVPQQPSPIAPVAPVMPSGPGPNPEPTPQYVAPVQPVAPVAPVVPLTLEPVAPVVPTAPVAPAPVTAAPVAPETPAAQPTVNYQIGEVTVARDANIFSAIFNVVDTPSYDKTKAGHKDGPTIDSVTIENLNVGRDMNVLSIVMNREGVSQEDYTRLQNYFDTTRHELTSRLSGLDASVASNVEAIDSLRHRIAVIDDMQADIAHLQDVTSDLGGRVYANTEQIVGAYARIFELENSEELSTIRAAIEANVVELGLDALLAESQELAGQYLRFRTENLIPGISEETREIVEEQALSLYNGWLDAQREIADAQQQIARNISGLAASNNELGIGIGYNPLNGEFSATGTMNITDFGGFNVGAYLSALSGTDSTSSVNSSDIGQWTTEGGHRYLVTSETVDTTTYGPGIGVGVRATTPALADVVRGVAQIGANVRTTAGQSEITTTEIRTDLEGVQDREAYTVTGSEPFNADPAVGINAAVGLEFLIPLGRGANLGLGILGGYDTNAGFNLIPTLHGYFPDN